MDVVDGYSDSVISVGSKRKAGSVFEEKHENEDSVPILGCGGSKNKLVKQKMGGLKFN